MLRGMKKTPLSVGLVFGVCACMVLFSVLSVSFSSVVYVLAGGVIGLLVFFLNGIRKRGEAQK